MTLLVIAVLLSFLIGTFGYILTIFWLRPMLRYRSIKRRVMADIEKHDRLISDKPADIASKNRKDLNRIFRTHAAAMNTCYQEDLPDWYRLLLTRREESPAEAAKHLLALSNVKNAYDRQQRIQKVKQALNLKGAKIRNQNRETGN